LYVSKYSEKYSDFRDENKIVFLFIKVKTFKDKNIIF